MHRHHLAVLVVALAAISFTGAARAQYMYLDSNSDGVHTAADIMNVSGTPTTVDVWIRTDLNRNGSPADCPTGDGPLNINSYVVNMAVMGGTASFTNFVNQFTGANVVLQPFTSNPTEMTVGRGRGSFSPPGAYRIFTVTITGATGTPSLAIVPNGTLSLDATSFGSLCSGNDFDNTLKLGSDWFDVDGLDANAVMNNQPVITAPTTVFGATTSVVSVTASTSDPDAGENLTLTQSNNTPFYPATSGAGPSPNPSITLSATPTLAQTGSYQINWTVVDSHSASATATTALTISTDTGPPLITVPPTVSGTENSVVVIQASATDADGGELTLSETNNAPFFPPSFSVGPRVDPSIVLAGTPNFSQAGSYTITWQAIESTPPNLSAQRMTSLIIANLNRNPAITAPAVVNTPVNFPVSITGYAIDPDVQTLTLTQTNNAPFLIGPASAGPSFNPLITLTGTPTFTQVGSYTIAWSAVDSNSPSGSASATTAIVTGGGHRNPVIIVAMGATGTEGVPISITASAAQPDGENVTLCVANLPSFLFGGPCAGPSPNPALTITGTPGPNTAGSYTVTWNATDASGGLAAATTVFTIVRSNSAPVLTQPADMTLNEGSTATQQLMASDPENDPITFSKVGPSPFFMSVSPGGLVALAAGFSDAGSYTATVRASDGTSFSQKSFAVTVVNVNRCPIANAGGPYTGVLFVPVTFNGTGSSDPDGDALNYAWNFGDGATGAGATPLHTYTTTGTYAVTLSVDDRSCSMAAGTTATIANGFSATAFTTGGNKTTSLGSGKPFTCVEVEPVAGAFDVTNVNLASVKMVSMGTGSVSEIPADAGKTDIAGDKNGNGVAEIQACFGKEDLRRLFSTLPSGRNDVDVTITGNLTTGGSFFASLTLTVKSTGGALAANISPNPLNPSARLTYTTSKAGAVRVALYDLNGRLVQTYLDAAQGAGTHDVTIDGRAANGERLASSVYFLKIRTESDGEETKSLTILK